MSVRKPKIKSLARRRDVAGLVEATCYTEVQPSTSGPVTDSGAAVRAEAILALGTLGHDCGAQAVEARLLDPEDSVRCAAVDVLHARQDGGALTEALRSLPAAQGESREQAILAIFDLRASVSARAVADALVHSEDDELLGEQDARLFMGLVADSHPEARAAAIQLLIRSLRDELGIVVDRAAELLVRLAPTSVGALMTELRTGSAAAEAAYVLGRIGDTQAIEALVDALRSDDPRVRSECTAALGGFEAHEAVKPLLEATRDPDHRVRVQAAAALNRMGTSAVIVGVAALLEPMIEEAVRSRPQRRRRGSNGGSPPSAERRATADQRAR